MGISGERFKLYLVEFQVRVEFRVDFLLDEICFVLSRVPILDDFFARLDRWVPAYHRVPVYYYYYYYYYTAR